MMAVCGLAAQALIGAHAQAAQHLVKGGDDWEKLAARIRPGDEIILMPGRHLDADFDQLIGTSKKPIVIRAADEKNPPIIEAQREGIRIKKASFVTIRDLTIVGGTVSGITLGDGIEPARMAAKAGNGEEFVPPPQPGAGDAAQEALGGVLIRNVTIAKVGPRGQRHAISVSGLEGVRIEECLIEGWGGSGVEIIACRDVSISRCQFRGLRDHGQMHGIRVRAGSERVHIERCRFENAGERVICLGGASDLEEFRTPQSFEAARVNVERCIILGGGCTVTYLHADDCVVRSNTIVGPKHCVMALLHEQKDPRFTAGNRNVFGINIAVWEPGTLRTLAEISPKADVSKFVLEENIWWSGETRDKIEKLGPLPGKHQMPQRLDLDPQLNAELKPGEPSLQGFGA
jgi:hypothetical protein